MFCDTHCHLDFPEFDSDREELIRKCNAEGLSYIVNTGSSLESSLASLDLAKRFDFIYATVGIHPHEADHADLKIQEALAALVKKDKVVAVGEIGLDYYKNFSKPQNQKPLFQRLIRLGKDSGLPLVIHTRNAQADTLRMLNDAMPVKAVVHCFSGDKDFLKACLDLGFMVSFTCNITYKKAEDLRKIVELTPLESLLLETDAPYLSPEALRGRRNDPLSVKILAQRISEIKKVSIEKIAEVTTNNAKRFFNLK